ncbi:MAG: undecaprenyldiphospho-muramoylpentapeptide beta-N-acetylglucosaminyltransferase [Rikenellaceae bacterium]
MKKIILSGGGTGGHIYPAVAVAEALKERYGDDVELLFVGAEGRMEMDKIPALGYRIVGLPIAGLQRRFTWRNLLLPVKIILSIVQAMAVIRKFKADIVVGFGGYVSAPILWAASRCGVPTVVQEQNSYAGLTNKLVARRAKAVCVSYTQMDRFFDNKNIVLTGNPLRGKFGKYAEGDSEESRILRNEALDYFGLDSERPVILVVGGSLGTRTLNNMMCRWIEKLEAQRPEVQVIWQTGKFYETEMNSFLESQPTDGVWQGAFIERMDLAYAAADLVISRSGACTVSELCLMGKATIFVPSPNVAEDHQTKNALALVECDAAIMVADVDAVEQAMPRAIDTLKEEKTLAMLRKNITDLATPNAAESVVDEIEKVLKEAE